MIKIFVWVLHPCHAVSAFLEHLLQSTNLVKRLRILTGVACGHGWWWLMTSIGVLHTVDAILLVAIHHPGIRAVSN
jgi:hypothetical protein